MKIKAAFLAVALAAASATSVGSAPLSNIAVPSAKVGPTLPQDMTECQLDQYIRCMRSVGDHIFCTDQAMAQVCRR